MGLCQGKTAFSHRKVSEKTTRSEWSCMEERHGRETMRDRANLELQLAVMRHDFKRTRELQHDMLSTRLLWQCDGKAMEEAVAGDDTTFVAWHLEHCSVNDPSRLMPLAATCDRHEILARLWLAQRVGVPDELVQECVLAAVKGGSLGTVIWLHENTKAAWPMEALDVAAECGHLNVVKWLHEIRKEGCTTDAMDGAAENGHLAVVKWLHANRSEGCTTWAMDSAARKGHLDVVQWLHANRYEGCTKRAMVLAAARGFLEVVQWLHANRKEGCTPWGVMMAANHHHYTVVTWLIQNRPEIKCSADLFDHIIRARQLLVVKQLYDRQELKSWPRSGHAKLLFDLFQSDNSIDVSILQHVVRTRQQRYHKNAVDNPYAEQEEDRSACDQKFSSEAIPPTSVLKVSERHNVPIACCNLISNFAFGDDSTRVQSHKKAVEREWMHWFFCFTKHPSRDMVLLADRRNFDAARLLHDRLKCADRLQCSKRFMFATVANGDLKYIEWHMLNCGAHSLEEWLYAAVWTGRVDVIDFMREVMDRSNVSAESEISCHKMYHSLEASFVSVGERFDSEFMAADADNSSRSINDNDLRAIRGDPPEGLCADVTVTGLYGAIVNGHTDVVKTIYKNRLDLANWLKIDDGPDVLRRILTPRKMKMVAFFSLKRGMRLGPSDLDEAAIGGDLTRVMLICNLRLVDSMKRAIDIAAVRGDEAMLQVLVEHMGNPRYSTRAMDGAAEEGHLSIIEYLHTSGASCTRRAIDLAAKNGHIRVVEYLYQNRREGCSEWAIYWASACGHESIVRYLAARGVPCDVNKCVAVARTQGHQDIVDSFESREQTYVSQCSSRQLVRRRRRGAGQFDPSPSHVVYCELERELSPIGLPSDLQPGVPIPPLPVAALVSSLSIDWSIDNDSDDDDEIN